MLFRSTKGLSLVFVLMMLISAPVASMKGNAFAQSNGQGNQQSAQQGEGSPVQRLEVLRSRLDSLRRSLNGAIAVYNANDKASKKVKNDEANNASNNATSEDGALRLRGLEKEVGSLLTETANLRGKQDRAERFDIEDIAKLESALTDLNERVDAGLRGTADERRRLGGDAQIAASGSGKTKKKGGFFSKLNPFSGGDEGGKYDELTTTVAPGRDRELFEESVKQTRKGNYDTARQLFNVIITTYSESPYLPLAKLAIADTFYREGTTSALIQANASYREWLTFFPTHPLADRVMLKMAEAEMRQMGLPDRDIAHARKAEQQLKVVLQQFPATDLRDGVNKRLTEVQENLGMHSYQVANFYYDKFQRGTATNPKGAQSRLREIVEKYPGFSYMDRVLYDLGRTYIDEEEPDEAAKHFARLLHEFPNSEYAEKAGEELDKIGVARPQPDSQALQRPAPVRPGFTEKIFREILGTTPVTIDKSGVLISANSDGGDLLDEAVKNGGQLPSNLTPSPVIQRRAPARIPVPPTATNTAATPANESKSISIQPTRAGAPVGSSNVPAQQLPTPLTTNPQLPSAPTTDDAPPANTTPAATTTGVSKP